MEFCENSRWIKRYSQVSRVDPDIFLASAISNTENLKTWEIGGSTGFTNLVVAFDPAGISLKVGFTWFRTQDLLLEIVIHETTQNRFGRHPGHPKMYHSQNVLHNK